MDKRHLHHTWKKLKVFSQWQFLGIAVVFAVVAVLALRSNNLTAIHLRDQALKVDQQNGDTEAALKTLRQYVYRHMNTDLSTSTSVYPPIQLKYRYDRLVAAEKARVDQASTNTIYADAQKYCETNFPQSFYGAGRLPCIQAYIDSHPVTTAKAQPIADGLYKFNFISPVWSPDLAGWSLVLASFFFLLFIIRFGLERWFMFRLNQRL